MRKLKITFAIVVFHILSCGVYADVVIDVACSNPSQIQGISHHITSLKKNNVGQIIVSVRGQCVRLFSLQDDIYASERARLEILSELGVTFLVDENSLPMSKTEKLDVVKFAYIRSDLLYEIVKLQERDKYSYIHYASNAYVLPDDVSSDKKDIKDKKEKKLKFKW